VIKATFPVKSGRVSGGVFMARLSLGELAWGQKGVKLR
jgi:hypothetical protein